MQYWLNCKLTNSFYFCERCLYCSMFSLQPYTTLHGLVTGLGIHSSLFTKRVKREIHSFNIGNDSFTLKKRSIRTKNQRANSQPWNFTVYYSTQCRRSLFARVFTARVMPCLCKVVRAASTLQ